MLDIKVITNFDVIIPLIPEDLKLSENAFNKLAEAIKDNIKGKAPVKTGTLRDSIQSLATPNLATVWSELFYAPLVNFGTKPHDIFPQNAQSLSWLSGGNQIFAKHVSHPGTKSNPFFLTQSGNINKDTEEIVQKTLNDMTFEELFQQSK